jgi:hypothetical protein
MQHKNLKETTSSLLHTEGQIVDKPAGTRVERGSEITTRTRTRPHPQVQTRGCTRDPCLSLCPPALMYSFRFLMKRAMMASTSSSSSAAVAGALDT